MKYSLQSKVNNVNTMCNSSVICKKEKDIKDNDKSDYYNFTIETDSTDSNKKYLKYDTKYCYIDKNTDRSRLICNGNFNQKTNFPALTTNGEFKLIDGNKACRNDSSKTTTDQNVTCLPKTKNSSNFILVPNSSV